MSRKRTAKRRARASPTRRRGGRREGGAGETAGRAAARRDPGVSWCRDEPATGADRGRPEPRRRTCAHLLCRSSPGRLRTARRQVSRCSAVRRLRSLHPTPPFADASDAFSRACSILSEETVHWPSRRTRRVVCACPTATTRRPPRRRRHEHFATTGFVEECLCTRQSMCRTEGALRPVGCQRSRSGVSGCASSVRKMRSNFAMDVGIEPCTRSCNRKRDFP
ncbi:hypothetical protein MRX96_030049 [Rhipicephalus microplus]